MYLQVYDSDAYLCLYHILYLLRYHLQEPCIMVCDQYKRSNDNVSRLKHFGNLI